MDDAARRALEALYVQATQNAAPDFDIVAESTIEVSDAAGNVTVVPMAQVLAELFAEPAHRKHGLARAA